MLRYRYPLVLKKYKRCVNLGDKMDTGIIAGVIFTITTLIQLFSIYKLRRSIVHLREKVDIIEQLHWLHINSHNPIHVLTRAIEEDPESCRS